MHELAIDVRPSCFAASPCINWCIYLRPAKPRSQGFCSIELSVPLLPDPRLGVRQFAGLAQDALHLAVAPAAVVEVDQHAVRRPVLPQGAHDKGPRAITLDTMTLTDL